jgi:hypothetical protein
MFLSQIPPSGSSNSSAQTWAAVATALAGAIGAVLAKRRFSGRAKSSPSSSSSSTRAVTHSDLQTGLDQMRDRVAAGYLALGQKMDSSQKEILSAIADHSSTVEKRLDALESAVARLDERTKLAS